MTEPSPVAQLFNAVAPDYDQSGVAFFGPIAQLLVDGLDPQPGERCLDVGCGRGAVTRLLVNRVGPEGDVLGVDLSAGMVEHATRDVPGARFQVGDATGPPAGPWDVVSAGLVIFFLPDPPATLEAWYGVLRPGGRVGVTTFGQQDPVWESVDEELRRYLPARDPRSEEAMKRFATAEGVEAILDAAGFTDLTTTTTELPVVFADADQWWAFSQSTGQRRAWLGVPEAERPAVRARCVERLEGARQPDGTFRTGQQVRVTTGVRPA